MPHATLELVLRCKEAAQAYTGASETPTGITINSTTAYLLADALNVPVPTGGSKPHEPAEVEGKRLLYNLKPFDADLKRLVTKEKK